MAPAVSATLKPVRATEGAKLSRARHAIVASGPFLWRSPCVSLRRACAGTRRHTSWSDLKQRLYLQPSLGVSWRRRRELVGRLFTPPGDCIPAVFAVEPWRFDPRQSAQQACFLCRGDVTQPLRQLLDAVQDQARHAGDRVTHVSPRHQTRRARGSLAGTRLADAAVAARLSRVVMDTAASLQGVRPPRVRGAIERSRLWATLTGNGDNNRTSPPLAPTNAPPTRCRRDTGRKTTATRHPRTARRIIRMSCRQGTRATRTTTTAPAEHGCHPRRADRSWPASGNGRQWRARHGKQPREPVLSTAAQSIRRLS